MQRRLSIFVSAILSIATLSGTVFLGGCLLGNDRLFSFLVINPLDEQRIPGDLLGGLVGALLPLSFDIDVDLDAETSSRGTGIAQHVTMVDFELRITGTGVGALDSDDFDDFLSSMTIFIEPRSSSSRLPRVQVATIDSVPSGAGTISLETNEIDLIEYFREGARLATEATGRTPLDDITFDGTVTFEVEVL